MAQVDGGALAVALAATLLALLTYKFTAAVPGRLAVFMPEHVGIFAMRDSTPLRRAVPVFCGALVLGALALRLLPPAVLRRAWWLPSPRRAAIAAGALVVGVIVLQLLVLRHQPLPSPRAPYRAEVWLCYALGVGAFVAGRWLPPPLLRGFVLPGAVAAGLLLVLWPAASPVLLRTVPEELLWIDLHMASVFAGGELLARGFRLFSDVPATYGILTPVLLAAVLKAGVPVGMGDLVRAVQLFQALALGLFMLACWLRTRGQVPAGRMAALLLLLLVGAPFLSLGGVAVLYANQSGLRFLMMPVAVLAMLALARGPLVPASAAAGAVALLALLHNTETGIAITAALGFAWLVRVRTLGQPRWGVALGAGLLAAGGVLLAALALHRAVFGAWVPQDIAAGAPMLAHFAAGFAGMPPRVRLVALVLFCHAGYVVVRALGAILGRGAPGIDVTDAGIAALVVAWSPYYANRADDWNLWVSLVLYALLVAPAVAAWWRRPAWLAMMAAILVVPIPFAMAITNQVRWHGAALAEVREACVSGLSMPPDSCDEQAARAAELVRLAGPGDVLWVTGFPYVTLLESGLKPMAMPFDIFLAARTEGEFDAAVAAVARARPMAILLDGAPGTRTSRAITPQQRALQQRVVAAAGYAPCDLVPAQRWQAWLPQGACSEAAPQVRTLRARLGGGA